MESDIESDVDDDASTEAHGIGIDEELFANLPNMVDLDENYLIEELQSDNEGEGGVANIPRLCRFREEDICKDF